MGSSCGFVFLNDIVISLVFLPFIFILFVEDHPVIESRDFWRWLTSPFVICSVIVMSSMYLCILIPHSASILLTYTMNHKGPSHEPCGTAHFTVSHDDSSSRILTLCCLWYRKLCNQEIKTGWTPSSRNLSNSIT